MREFNFTSTDIVSELMKKARKAVFLRNGALFAGAAGLICELRDRLEIAEIQNAEMAEYFKKFGCVKCKHFCDATFDENHEPCTTCIADEKHPAWEWNGGANL